MIVGTGIDLIEVSRMETALQKKDNGLIKKIFTKLEIDYCKRKANVAIQSQHYAGRFAAKESFFKAIGTGWRGGIHWKEVEVVNDKFGKPDLALKGKAKEIVKKMNVNAIHLSISHTKKTATAIVILENL